MILVAGGTGRLGTQLVGRLRQRGSDVRVFTRDRGRAAHLVQNGVEIVEGDVRDVAAVRRAVCTHVSPERIALSRYNFAISASRLSKPAITLSDKGVGLGTLSAEERCAAAQHDTSGSASTWQARRLGHGHHERSL